MGEGRRDSPSHLFTPLHSMTTMHKEKAEALLSLLSWAHAEQYTVLDDEMIDDCSDWVGNLTEDEISDIVLSVYQQGL